MSKLDEMIEAEVIRICKERSGDDVSMCTCGATSEMATLLRSDTAFRAMCEERLERLEYERNATEETYLESADWRGLEYSRDEGTIGSLDRQISALRTLLEG